MSFKKTSIAIETTPLSPKKTKTLLGNSQNQKKSTSSVPQKSSMLPGDVRTTSKKSE